MAGYHGYSKSNNAVEAEKNGRYPASKIAKITGVPTSLIKQHVPPCEWHHTSRWYNQTDYFDPEKVRTFFHSETGEKILAQHKAEKTETTIYHDCKVKWLEWSGSKARPKCTKMEIFGATVSVKGQTATISHGKTSFQKRLSTNGFDFTPDHTKAERERIKKEAKSKKKYDQILKQILAEFRVYAKGKKFEVCDYFHWRDVAQENSEKTTFAPAKHIEIKQWLIESGFYYAARSIERLVAGNRNVVRIGLKHGVRVKGEK